MTDQPAEAQTRADRFLSLHRPGEPLLMPNPWDAGSARLLEHAGFEALATTSSGHAATLARLDGSVTKPEALAHAGELVAAVDVPVSADLEHGFADDPTGVATTVAAAVETGLAGCSIEDSTGDPRSPIYDAGLAEERVAAAVEAAHTRSARIVLTARAENHIHGRDDLDDTIARLTSFAEAGADVVFAPGLIDVGDIGRVVNAVDTPLSVLLFPDGPTVADLAAVGVARISVGGFFSLAALGAVVDMAERLRADGALAHPDLLKTGRAARQAAFG